MITLIESEAMAKGDFIRTENYNLRLRPTGARKVTGEVNRWFNKTVQYQGKEYPWHYVMLLKARQLAHCLVGKKMPDFVAPAYADYRFNLGQTQPYLPRALSAQ